MKFNSLRNALAIVSIATMISASVSAERVASFSMEVNGNQIAETVSARSFTAEDRVSKPMSIISPSGSAWRTDGYTSFLSADLGNIVTGNQMTATLTFAVDTYTIIQHERAEVSNENMQSLIAGNMTGDSGFGFFMGRTGRYSFRAYIGGRLVIADAGNDIIPLWQWNQLTGVVDGNTIRLYKNGVEVASASASNSGFNYGTAPVTVARAASFGGEFMNWGINLITFNGAFDSLTIDNSVVAPTAYTPAYANLNIPSNRYADDRLRAKFHGQPGMNWTNETHGLYYNKEDGKYHAFFQKTGSAPIMSHQHWGHIVSDDLLNWKDEKPALAPGEYYDIKGCWSGCVFTDDIITGGKPAILYTGVDFAQPYAAFATCLDPVNLREWKKESNNPIVKLSDPANEKHFRDTYFFRPANQEAFMIIGSDNEVQLYKYDGSNWNRNGNFYEAEEGVDKGFTEMPNVTYFPDADKWLMTTSPLSSNDGTVCLYRIGDINEGKFSNYSKATKFDILARDGYGLLSPSIANDKDGNIIAMGIVADKMPTNFNIEHGFAHLYSLPRQLSIADGKLRQKPFNGVYALRNNTCKYIRTDAMTLNGVENINPVRGREAEIKADFTVGDASFGFNFLKNAKGKSASLSYNPAFKELKVDFGGIARVRDDKNINTFSAILPEAPAKGETMTLHLFIDHTILDIFVNDTYAASVRIFPTEDNADLIEIFSNGDTQVGNVEAYIMGDGDCSAEPIVPKEFTIPANSGKVAFLKSAVNVSPQEQAALDFYTSKLGKTVVTTSDAEDIKASDFDCLWLHIDRKDVNSTGYKNLPAEFINADLLEALKKFVADGGNLMLTGYATQLLVAIDRIKAEYAPTELGFGDGARGGDEWSVNPMAFSSYKAASHALFKDMDQLDDNTYGLLYGGGNDITRENHNSMWKLAEISYKSKADNNVKKFEEDCNAGVIGTWGQDKTDNFAGIIEFYPMQNEDLSWGGNIIANGLAACQWYVADGYNAYAQNLQLMTANMMSYLADKDGIQPFKPAAGGEYAEPSEQPEIPENPDNGNYSENSGKVAFLKSAVKVSTQEQAALNFFTSYLGKNVISTDKPSAIKASDFDCLWIHIDRKDVTAPGYRNLPDEYLADDLINAIETFVADGGNLMLSGYATQLLVAINRIDSQYAPTTIGFGNGGNGTDEWTLNPSRVSNYDAEANPLFTGMEESHAFGHTTYGLLYGGGDPILREDHNCMWNLAEIHFSSDADNRVKRFEKDCNARVIATWGQETNDEHAGIVEFFPIQNSDYSWGGSILANGLAACQWVVENGTNKYQENLQMLTANMMSYLADKDGVAPFRPDEGGQYIEPVVPEVPESTGRVAMFVAARDYDELSKQRQEFAAYEYFIKTYADGEVIYSNDFSRINVDDFDCVWIHIDRTGLGKGWNNLPNEVSNDYVVSTLKQYVADGGNLFLSKQALQLAHAIGRIDREVNEWNSGDGGRGRDNWDINISPNIGENWAEHPIFSGLETHNNSAWGTFISMLGNPDEMWREDHNALWEVRGADAHRDFCKNYNARILGTWGHEDGVNYAGLVEFMPRNSSASRAIAKSEVDARKGTVMALGLAAYEWAPREAANVHHAKVETLTSNIIGYLSPVEKNEISTGMESICRKGNVSVADGIVYYNGFELPTRLCIYSADGTTLLNTTVTGNGAIFIGRKGLMIVNTSDATFTSTVKIMSR